MARTVNFIPATREHLASAAHMTATLEKRRTAAYARVSTDKDEQETSFDAQVSYYTEYIERRSDWTLIKIYTDEGITGCSTKHREGFNEMIADALDGKLDLIVTKSVSRFARNTVDSLQTIRNLKEKGVEVYFEKEQIWSFDGKGELLITIMSSLAQEEARSISENVTWGQRKRMADGKVSLPYKQFLGYKKGDDGLPEIVPAEAEIVRGIYKMFIEGKTPSAIAKHLMANKIPSPAGKERWQVAVVRSILTNEKYKGEAILQKQFTTNFLTKSRKKNEGEIPQYHVENSHPAIISPDDFDTVQAEIERRTALGRPMTCSSPFSARLVCGDCGGYFGRKTWGSYKDDKTYKRYIWRCNRKYEAKTGCDTSHIKEDELRAKFIEVWNSLSENRETLLADCKEARKLLCDCTELDTEVSELQREIEVVTELIRKAIYENARTEQDQTEWNERNNGYLERQRAAHSQLTEVQAEIQRRQNTSNLLGRFIRNMKNSPLTLDEFDEKLWSMSVDSVTVHRDLSAEQAGRRLVFRLRDGTEVESRLD